MASRVICCLLIVLSLSFSFIFSSPSLADGSFTIDPVSGQVGTTITYTLSGWTPLNAVYYVWFDSNGNGVRDTGEPYRARTLSGGADSYTFSAPQNPGGSYNVCFDLLRDTTIDASFPFTITPKMLLSYSSGSPGLVIGITGNGYQAGAYGWIWFDSSGNITRDPDEPQVSVTATTTGIIPGGTLLTIPDVSAGTYHIYADIPEGDSIEVSADFTVTPGIQIDPSTGFMDTVTTISVTGGSFDKNQSGFVWFDTDGDNARDTDEPQVAVTSTDSGTLPPGVTIDTPLLPPASAYRVCADIPTGTPIEANKLFQTAPTTTRLTVTKYDAHGSVAATQTLTYQWLESNLDVQGGDTHYYAQGPTFNDSSYDAIWDPGETVNIDSRDYGHPEGTDLKDICSLVGASPGDVINIRGSDKFNKWFDYDDIYNPEAAQGKMVVCWYNTDFGGYVPDYSSGMRLLFFADDSTNPQHRNVFGDWDMHQTIPASRWHFFVDEDDKAWPSSSGLSVTFVYNIDVYEPNLVSCDASGNYKDSFAPGDTVYVKGTGLDPGTGYNIWIQSEPVLKEPLDSYDRPGGGTYTFGTAGDPSGGQETVGTDGSGDFTATAIWTIPVDASSAGFDIVADNQAAGTTGTYDTADAIDNPGWAGFSVTSASEFISFTITDYNDDGIRFGPLNPGMENQPADGQPDQTAVTLTVGDETNVPVDIRINGTDFSGPGTIDIENIKYNNTNDVGGAQTLTVDPATWYSVPAFTECITYVYYWITIPDAQPAGDYTSTFTFEAVKKP